MERRGLGSVLSTSFLYTVISQNENHCNAHVGLHGMWTYECEVILSLATVNINVPSVFWDSELHMFADNDAQSETFFCCSQRWSLYSCSQCFQCFLLNFCFLVRWFEVKVCPEFYFITPVFLSCRNRKEDHFLRTIKGVMHCVCVCVCVCAHASYLLWAWGKCEFLKCLIIWRIFIIY